MTALTDDTFGGFLAAVTNNCDAILEIDISRERYHALSSGSLFQKVLPEEGPFRLLFQTLFFPEDNPSEVTREYTELIYRDILRSQLCHRRIQFRIDGASYLRLFAWCAAMDGRTAYVVISYLQYPDTADDRIRRKEYALGKTYLSSMFVDLDTNECSAIHVPEIEALDHNTIEMSYTAWQNMTAKAFDEKNRARFLSLTDAECLREALQDKFSYSFDIQMMNVARQIVWVRHTMTRIPDPETGHLQLIHTVTDIDSEKTETLQRIQHLEDQSSYDAVTASYTRIKMKECIREEAVHSEETGNPFYLLHISQSRLIHVFSANQFQEMDQLLSRTADLLQAVMSRQMIMARWTNTSLAILCKDMDLDEVEPFCRKLMETHESVLANQDATLRLSIGLVCVSPGEDLKDVFLRMDLTLSKAMESSQSAVISDRDLGKSNARPGASRILDQIEEHIHHNYMEKMTLRDLSQQYYINSAYLGQLFIKRYHVSFSEYLCRERLSHAAHELVTTDRLIYEIANSVGYTNLNYFIRQFTEHYGSAPSRYRKEHRKTTES